MGLVFLLIRLFLTLFMCCFVGFVIYIMWLGLNKFFNSELSNKSDNSKNNITKTKE